MKGSTLVSVLLLSAAVFGSAQAPPATMVFSDTDVSQVLMAISKKTGANIVYAAGTEKTRITLKIAITTPEEAIRGAAAAGGLAYRKVGDVYVVASPTSMRQALQPYAKVITFSLPAGRAEADAAKLQEALPYVSVRAIGQVLLVEGVPEDIRGATKIIDELERTHATLRPITDVVVLNQASASQVSTVVKALFSEVEVTGSGGTAAGGMIGLAGPEDKVHAARRLIESLDVPAEGGPNAIVYTIYRLKYSTGPSITEFLKNAKLNVEAFVGPEAYSPPRAGFNPLSALLTGTSNSNTNSTSGLGTSGGFFGGTQMAGSTGLAAQPAKPGEQARNIVLKGTQSAVDAALKLVESLDVKPMQVNIEVQVTEAAPSFTENLGVDWNLQNTLKASETNLGAAGIGLGHFTRSLASFTATLNASIKSGEAKLLANPHVRVLDNNDADIFIGDTIRARLVQSTVLGGQTVEIQEFPVGIILLIRPRIGSDGYITMHVNPVVSTVDSLSVDNVPQTSTREAETTVIVRDGETIVIGGLIRDDYTRTISEVPFLSKLPIIGELFRNRSTNKTRKDVIVTITPHIVKD